MASTLAFLPSSSPVLTSLVPPPSQDFVMQQMPNVFVIPPEEEQDYNPPWCYFDATKAVKDGFCTSPDMDALDVALSFCQQTDNRSPAFRRSFTNESQETIVMPRRRSLIKFRNIDPDMEEDGQTDIRSRSGVRRYDEEIVEVVKVRRNEGMSDIGEQRKMKKSNTFRARASQALRSIKLNVGGGKNQRRTSVTEPHPQSELQTSTLPTRHSCQEELSSPRPSSPSVLRRRSLTFSQFFTTFKENQSSRPATPSDDLMSATSLTLVEVESASPTRPMSPVDSIASHQHRLQTSPSLEDCIATPSKSPTLVVQPLVSGNSSKPPLSKRKSFRRRLSVLELQKIFSLGSSGLSSSDPTSPPYHNHVEDLFSPMSPRSKSMDSNAVLSSSSQAPSSTAVTDLTSRPSSSSQTSDTTGKAEEADLEMRLDSLHFDSLHIDPNELFDSL